jgi:formate hydrogenlyase subunit 3/multisubunit Na+/H+ antiporter MnhD subunit
MDVNLMIMLIALPLIIAIINIVLPLIVRKILSLAVVGYTLIATYLLYTNPAVSVTMFGETIFILDKMSIFALVFVQILSFIILIFSLKGVSPASEKSFFVLYPMTVAFCNGVILSENIISFLMFWGLAGLTLYLFALLGTTKEAPQTAKKTFILIGGSDAFLIFGFVLMWHLQPAAGWSLSAFSIPLTTGTAIFAFILLLIAAFAKAGGFPLHTWVPDFSKDAPVESAAFLPASLDKLLGIYLLARMMISYFTVELVVNLIVVTLGALTVITAVMMAMNQHNGRKLLGYHAVSQVGYMIMGVGSGSILAFAGGLFHLINHTIYKSNLFLSLGSVEKKTGTNELDDLGGLGKVMPITFIMALIGALSISGIPPFNGFFSKWMIYQGLLEKTASIAPGYQIWLLTCIILAVFGSALTLASFMKFIHAIFLGTRPAKLDKVTEAPANQWLATGLLSALCICFGIFAVEIPLRQFIMPVLADLGWSIESFPGLYNPQLIVMLFAMAFIIGFGIYLFTRKVRYDDVYLGGMSPAEQFRVLGTEFYNEIRNMKPLKAIYNAAERKYFDMYDVSGNSTFAFSRLFQKAHPGQLQLYVLYIVLGMLIFIWMIY